MRITIYGRESEIQNIIGDIFDVIGRISLIQTLANFDTNGLFSSEHKNHDRRFFYRGNKTI